MTAVLAALLAIFGYDWVHRVFRFLLIISLPCYAIISIAILVRHAGGTAPAHPVGFIFAAFITQFTVAAAYTTSPARLTSPTIRVTCHAGPRRAGSFKKVKTSRTWRAGTIIGLAVLWYAVGASIPSSTTAVTTVLNSLTLMLYLLVPWTALNLVDFFFVRHGHYAITDIFRPDGVYGAWGWRGLTALFLGFACEIPFTVLPSIGGFSFTGPVPAHLTNGVDYSWIVGLLVAGLAYLLLSRSLNIAAEQSAIEASERDLTAIDVAAQAAG